MHTTTYTNTEAIFWLGLFFTTVFQENVLSAAATKPPFSTPNTIPCHGSAMQ